MSHPLIDSFVELERVAAQEFWKSEDRTAWRDDLLRQCETRDLLSLKSYLGRASGSLKSPAIFPVFMWDNDLRRCFSIANSINSQETTSNEPFSTVLNSLKNLSPSSVAGLFLRPGFWMTESWQVEENDLRDALANARSTNSMIVRCGFLTQQADILLASDLGFSAIQIHAGSLDLYELQMAIELARDCRLCPIVSVATEEEMEQAIQTDAPHIALCHFPMEGIEQSAKFIQSALPRVPANCTRVLLTAAANTAEATLLTRLGFTSTFQFNPDT